MTTPSEDVLIAAKPSDREAARNWYFIYNTAKGWNVQAQDQFIENYCEFSREIEMYKDEYELTYNQITDLLLLGHIS